jgi:hypothetical protein
MNANEIETKFQFCVPPYRGLAFGLPLGRTRLAGVPGVAPARSSTLLNPVPRVRQFGMRGLLCFDSWHFRR